MYASDRPEPSADQPASRYFVYILRCCDRSYYVGHTADLTSRVDTHNRGEGSAWTRSRRPVQLVYHESFPSITDAVKRERQLKGWTRSKKESLIRGDIDSLRSRNRKAH